ncbi:unnamed protein product [Pedinophyceae sp. YPF-701]|nr:unnamed protein product [Pedinophyceae sp. YPF-701]
MSVFEEMGVMPELIRAIEELGWLLPTPVQQESVPLILGGGDVMAAAETGSGKTGAFALPILQTVHEARRGVMISKAQKASKSGGKQASFKHELSLEDRDPMLAISPDGLVCQSRAPKWSGGRGSTGVCKGKAYFEATVRDEGLCRVGWSTKAASLELGTDKHGFGFGGTGKASHAKQFLDYGEAYGLNDTIGCLLDCDSGTVSFSKNGTDLGVAFEIPGHLKGQTFYPAVCLKNAEIGFNFGATQLRSQPPAGYVALASAPAATLVAGSAVEAAPADAKGSGRAPLALVLEPTRDLAEQTLACFRQFATHLSSPSLRSELLVGGMDTKKQARAIADGVDVVVGTPARVLDFAESGKLSLAAVRFFVLDEADRLTDDDVRAMVLKMFKMMPKGGAGVERLQVLMFSATLHSKEIKTLSEEICQTPVWVDLKGRDHVPDTVDHAVAIVDPQEDRSWLQAQPATYTDGCHTFDDCGAGVQSKAGWSEAVKRLKQRVLQRVIDQHNIENAMIFCRTNYDCDLLERFLNELGGGRAFRGKAESGKEGAYSCCVLGGARSMEERRRNLEAFKDGDVRFLICTDVAARGIDISGLPYVINMTLPDRSEDYIHRIGRVGRAGKIGLAISLVAAVPERVWYCSKKGYKPWFDPKPKDVQDHTIWYDESGLLKEVEARVRHPIARMGADLSLPAEIVAKLSASGGRYGEEAGGDATQKESQQRVEEVRPAVVGLAELEVAAQHSFLALRQRFSGAAR